MRPAPASLSSRLDPDDSLSDWTLKMISTDSISNRKRFHAHTEEIVTQLPPEIGARAKMYFVHKTQLAVGERRSEYFHTLFKSTKSEITPLLYSESRDDIDSEKRSRMGNVTKIELLPNAAAWRQ
jgi:hypothetical protein